MLIATCIFKELESFFFVAIVVNLLHELSKLVHDYLISAADLSCSFFSNDTTQTGYPLGMPESRSTVPSPERSLSPAACCLIRAFMHSAFLWASCHNEVHTACFYSWTVDSLQSKCFHEKICMPQLILSPRVQWRGSHNLSRWLFVHGICQNFSGATWKVTWSCLEVSLGRA